MKNFWLEFKKFITRGNVVDMAVGVTVATAFTAIVTAFTKGFISPILALLTSDADLAHAKWVIRPELTELAADGTVVVTRAEVAIMWGGFLQAILDFLLIAFILFLMMRIAHKISSRASQFTTDLKSMAGIGAEEAAAAAKAKAEADAKAKAEAEAAAEVARVEAEKKEAEARAEAERLRKEIELLTEIRDLLKKDA